MRVLEVVVSGRGSSERVGGSSESVGGSSESVEVVVRVL